MTIDEFKAVLAMTNLTLGVDDCYLTIGIYSIPRKYTAYLWRESDFDNSFTSDPIGYLKLEATGHTKKAALKKLKDAWYYEGRKNGNN